MPVLLIDVTELFYVLHPDHLQILTCNLFWQGLLMLSTPFSAASSFPLTESIEVIRPPIFSRAQQVQMCQRKLAPLVKKRRPPPASSWRRTNSRSSQLCCFGST